MALKIKTIMKASIVSIFLYFFLIGNVNAEIITWNNTLTKDNDVTFVVYQNDTITFSVDATNQSSNFIWEINKIKQDNDESLLEWVVPNKKDIWEIRVDESESNSYVEWVVSTLDTSEAPSLIEYFIDGNTSSDPWGNPLAKFDMAENIDTSNAFLKADNKSVNTRTVINSTTTNGTWILRYKYSDGNPKALGTSYPAFMNIYFVRDNLGVTSPNIHYKLASDSHDYSGYKFTKDGTQGIAIGRTDIDTMPVPWTNDNNSNWHELRVIRNVEGYIYYYIDGILKNYELGYIPESINSNYLLIETTIPKSIEHPAFDQYIDNIEIYDGIYLYPERGVVTGVWWDEQTWSNWNKDVLNVSKRKGIIVGNYDTTLKDIYDSINDDSLFEYYASNNTAFLHTNISVLGGAQLIINNETLVIDSNNNPISFRVHMGADVRIVNSTIDTSGDDPFVWTITSPLNERWNEGDLYSTTEYQFKGIIKVLNSTINNSAHMILYGASAVVFENSVFSNLTEIDDDYYWHLYPNIRTIKEGMKGGKAIWIANTREMSEFSIKNSVFSGKNNPVDISFLSGDFTGIINIIDSKFQNSNIFVDADYFDTNNVSLINADYDIITLKERSEIKQQYYLDIFVINNSSNAILFANVSLESIENNLLTNLVQVYDWHTLGSPTNIFRYIAGNEPITSTTTNVMGHTALPSNEVGTFVLTDYIKYNDSESIVQTEYTYGAIVSYGGKTVTLDGIKPDSSWYRENPNIPTYTITAIIPESDSTGPHITGFAPSEDNPFNTGESKIFRIWTDESLDSMNWYLDGSLVSSGSMNYTWVTTEGGHTIIFEGSNTNGAVSQRWDINGGISGVVLTITESFPVDTAPDQNNGSTYEFNVTVNQPLTSSSWYLDGDSIASDTLSLDHTWTHASIHNITFMGSNANGSISETWVVNVNDGSPSSVAINPATQTITPNHPFTLTIPITPAIPIVGAQFDLNFDNSLATVTTVTEGNLLNQDGASTLFNSGTINNAAGTVRNIYGSILGETSVSTQGSFATIGMTAGSITGYLDINLTNVKISDGDSNAAPYTLTNATVLIDTAPVLNSIGAKSVDEDNALTFTTSASDVDGDSLTYSATNLPTGASFNTATGAFSWTPAVGQVDTYVVTFEVTDGYISDSETVTITVNNANNAPVITTFVPANSLIFNELDVITVGIIASDADGDALSYTIKIDGVTKSTSSNYVWETDYSSAGTYTIDITVSDGTTQVTDSRTITINDVRPRWDVNEDGTVDVLDISIIGQKYGTSVGAPYPRWDVNQDGGINVQDMTLTGSHFGETVA